MTIWRRFRALPSGTQLLICCLAVLAALALVMVPGISLGGLGLLAIVLLCPLMHLMMHGGHGDHSRHQTRRRAQGAHPHLSANGVDAAATVTHSHGAGGSTNTRPSDGHWGQ